MQYYSKHNREYYMLLITMNYAIYPKDICRNWDEEVAYMLFAWRHLSNSAVVWIYRELASFEYFLCISTCSTLSVQKWYVNGKAQR